MHGEGVTCLFLLCVYSNYMYFFGNLVHYGQANVLIFGQLIHCVISLYYMYIYGAFYLFSVLYNCFFVAVNKLSHTVQCITIIVSAYLYITVNRKCVGKDTHTV